MNQKLSAVKEYQKINALIVRRIEETHNKDTRIAWVKHHNDCASEIAKRYGLTIEELIDAWLKWVQDIEITRKMAHLS